MLGIALAQTATKPQLSLQSFLVITETKDGRSTERFEAANSAKPGQTLEYRVIAQNDTAAAVSKLVMDLPIPRSTQYIDGSATLNAAVAVFTVSADGKRLFAVPPLKRNVVKDGKTTVETIPATEYTNLRWTVKSALEVKTRLEFKARVKVK